METVEIVIRIPKERYEELQKINNSLFATTILHDSDWDILGGTPLPKGHGDLVDKQKLLLEKDTMQEAGTLREYDILFSSDVENAPTVIKADKEEV